MRLIALGIILLFFSYDLQAKKASGCFNASQSCKAYQSFRKKTNPEGIRLEEGGFYPIVESSKKNKAYRVRLKGIKRPLRWVSKSCGERLNSCVRQGNSKDKSGKVAKRLSNNTTLYRATKIKKSKPKKQPQYLLALSWQPSFCESHKGKKECRTQTTNRYDASHWSLHGLWPQPRGNTYCGVNDMDKGIDRHKQWHLLAPVKLSQKTATELAFVMPAVASNLQRHEWIKHGTCYGSNAEDYFSDAISLTQQINNSIVGKLFNKGVGKRVNLKQVRAHFDKAFGKGAGSKVDMRCDHKGRVSELWINLKGDVEDDTKIADLLKNALRAGTTCQMGRIDKANR